MGMASQGRNPELSRRSRRVVVDVPAPIPLEALGSRRLSGTILPHLILRGINHLTLKLPHTRTQIRKNRAQMLQIGNTNVLSTPLLPPALPLNQLIKSAGSMGYVRSSARRQPGGNKITDFEIVFLARGIRGRRRNRRSRQTERATGVRNVARMWQTQA